MLRSIFSNFFFKSFARPAATYLLPISAGSTVSPRSGFTFTHHIIWSKAYFLQTLLSAGSRARVRSSPPALSDVILAGQLACIAVLSFCFGVVVLQLSLCSPWSAGSNLPFNITSTEPIQELCSDFALLAAVCLPIRLPFDVTSTEPSQSSLGLALLAFLGPPGLEPPPLWEQSSYCQLCLLRPSLSSLDGNLC